MLKKLIGILWSLVLLVGWIALGLLLKKRFQPNTDIYSAVIYWGLYIVFSLPAFSLLGLVTNAIEKYIQKYIQRRTPCPHGVKGGAAMNLCDSCVAEKKERNRQEEAKNLERLRREESERQEKARKAEIRKQAELLLKSENERLTKMRLKNQDYLLALTPQNFEDAVADMFKRLGYSVKQTPYTNDQGKDAIIIKDGFKYIVECKHYGRDKYIGRPHLQKLFAAMQEEHSKGGFMVATGRFANTAVEYAQKYKIELIGLDRLSALMQQAYPSDFESDYFQIMCQECGDIIQFSLSEKNIEKPCINRHIVRNDREDKFSIGRPIISKVLCDRCGKEMRLINGKKGKFWGCRGYPFCRNTKPYNAS